MQNIIMQKFKIKIRMDKCYTAAFAVHSILILFGIHWKIPRLIPWDFLSFSLSSYIILNIDKAGSKVKVIPK